MKVLLAIPHVFAPKPGSLYSSQTEAKRESKKDALLEATIGNLNRHRKRHWIHASLGYLKPVVNRERTTDEGIDLTIQVYSPKGSSLAATLPSDPDLSVIDPKVEKHTQIPMAASRCLLEQADEFDVIGYIEDDIAIHDRELFSKILFLDSQTAFGEYAFLPHRCEHIMGRGDVILSGDPDGGRPGLFWDTGETIELSWPLGNKQFYRATNPHSGCYFLSKRQAKIVRNYWQQRNWIAEFQLSGPLEQAGSGLLLPVLKVMKPSPEHYRFLMVHHQDSLWRRHRFE